MDKESLLTHLESALKIEESNTAEIARFYIEDFDWGDVEDAHIDSVKVLLKTIREQTLEHEKIVNEMIEWIRTGGSDEF